LILAVPALAAYLYMVLYSIPLVSSFAGGRQLPDLLPLGYSPEYVRDLLDRLGEAGRHAYLWRQLPADFVYPGLFAVTLSLLAYYLVGKTSRMGGNAKYVVLLPLAAGFFDYCENLGLVSLLLRYPRVADLHIRITEGFTLLKSGFSTLSFIALASLVLLLLARAIKPK